MNALSLIIGIVMALLGGLAYYFKSKSDTAGALLQNQDMKNQINELDKTVSKNDGLLLSEEEKRKQMEDQAKQEENKNVSKDELTDFFNNRKSDN